MSSLGYKLTTPQGVEVAVFPGVNINITQGANAPYSHAGTKNTDNASGVGMRDLYAPCKLKVVSNQTSAGYGIVIYHTVEPVLKANGTIGHFTLVCMHDNASDRWTLNSVYEQGDNFYTEGDADPSGLTTGVHVHFEMAHGHETSRVLGSGGRYHIKNPCYIDEIFFKNGATVVNQNASGNWKGDKTFNFKEYDGLEPPSSNIKEGQLVTFENTNEEVKVSKRYEVIKVNGKEITMREVEQGSPSYVGKTMTIKRGTTLYDKNGKAYPSKTTNDHSVKVTDQNGNLLGFSASWLVGVSKAYFKI